jgi:MFS superfamily sulfate permease-like transporter
MKNSLNFVSKPLLSNFGQSTEAAHRLDVDAKEHRLNVGACEGTTGATFRVVAKSAGRKARTNQRSVEDGRMHILQDKDIPYDATIFRIHGPLLFGATDKISVVTENLHQLPPVVILRLRNMTALDATGLFALEEVARNLHASKRTLILCGAREQPAQLIHQGEFSEVVGSENICDNVQEALRRAEEVYERLEAKFVASKS